jgi:hypothetical protein
MNTKHHPTVSLTITAISIASLIGMLSPSGFAQAAQSEPALAAQSQAEQAAAAMRAVARHGMLESQVAAMHAVLKRATPETTTGVDRTAAAVSDTFNTDQGPGAGPIGPGQGCDLFPAPASIGTAVPLSYFGPPPSTTNPSLVGPVQLLNTGQIDTANGTITIPLYLGYMKGSMKKVWYILTDVDDPGVAAELGLNYSAKMTFMGPAARTAHFNDQGT